MQNFKKMQKSALNICIYEIKAVPLHRQIQIEWADNRQNMVVLLCPMPQKYRYQYPVRKLQWLSNPHSNGFDNG